MRFKTEFVLKYPYGLDVLETYKVRHQLDIGNQVGSAFDWDSSGNDQAEKFRLDLEAFPTDQWILFKRKLFFELERPNPDAIKILQMIKDLEFNKSESEEIDKKPL